MRILTLKFSPLGRATLPSLALTSLALAGCAGDDVGTATQGSSGSTSSASAATDDATSEGTSGAETGSTGASTSASSTTTTGATTTETSGSTTGEELCHFGSTGDSGGSVEPWLELTHKGEQLSDGATVGLECGLQGLFMLELVPYFGGFEPAGESVIFDIVVDVDGFNENPDGHFYSTEDYYFYVGCESFDGGVGYILAIIPPDTIPDLAVLDGAAAEVTVTMHPDGAEPVVVSHTVTLSAAADENWEFCEFGR